MSLGKKDVGSATISFSSTQTETESYTTTNTNTTTVTATFPLSCPAYTICKGVAALYSGMYDVPYTGIVYFTNGKTSTVKGKYMGLQYYTTVYTVTTVTSIDL